MVDFHFLSIASLFKNKDHFDLSTFFPKHKPGFLHVGFILPGKKYGGGVGNGSSAFDNESIDLFDEQPQKTRETDWICAFSSQCSPPGFPAAWLPLI